MGDVSYSINPQKSSILRYRPSTRGQTKLNRRSRLTAMACTAHHTCVAHYTEPVFCSNDGQNFTSLWMQPLAEAGPIEQRPWDDVSEDNEAGGVPLVERESDTAMSDALANTHIREHASVLLSTQRRTAQASHAARILRDFRRHDTGTDYPRSVLGSSHPRPDSRDTWQEEDGRRLRFALDDSSLGGPDHDASRAAGDMSRAGATANEQPGPEDGAQPDPSGFSLYDTSDILHEPVEPRTSIGEMYPHLWELPSVHQNVSNYFDEDALAVDDPRRSYGVADFIGEWKERCHDARADPKTMPAIDYHPCVILPVRQPQEELDSLRSSTGVYDWQGINWTGLGTCREDALQMRLLMHPSKKLPPEYTSPSRVCQPRPANPAVRYRFRDFQSNHRAAFAHYQLRNSLAACDRNNLFYASGSVVTQASLSSPSMQRTILDLSNPSNGSMDFRITGLAASQDSADGAFCNDKVLLAGGFYGEFAMVNLSSHDREVHQGHVTHAYNGLVNHVQVVPHRRTGVLQATFCSNDNKVRVMDLTTLRFTSEFDYTNALNCSATSPDGRLRALIGDSNQTLVTNAESGETLVTLEPHTDHGFACAWSPDGRQLATGAQDGVVALWDARSWSQPLKCWESAMSCARSLHFTKFGTIVAAESEDIINIYDPCRLEAQEESIRFFGSIAGAAVVDGGEEIIVANADKMVGGLLSFDMLSQGLNRGTYGERVHQKVTRSRGTQRELVDGLSALVI